QHPGPLPRARARSRLLAEVHATGTLSDHPGRAEDPLVTLQRTPLCARCMGVAMVSSFASGLGAISLVETIAEIFFFVAIFSAFAIFFIVAIGNRSDADPAGSRPIAAYLFSGAFLFIWIAYFGIVAAAFSIINLIGSHPDSSFLPSTLSSGNSAIRACVLGVLLVVFAGGVGYLHLKKGNALADDEANPSGPTKRVMRSYVALTSFIAII